MKKYRKRPLEIHAVKWTGRDIRELDSLFMLATQSTFTRMTHAPGDSDAYDLEIDTLEGTMTVSVGDYVICGIKGELYPCKPDIFEATYEEVEQPNPQDAT